MLVVLKYHRSQWIGFAFIEQVFIGQGARCDNARHIALDDAFGFGWVLYLVANSNAMARLNHAP